MFIPLVPPIGQRLAVPQLLWGSPLLNPHPQPRSLSLQQPLPSLAPHGCARGPHCLYSFL